MNGTSDLLDLVDLPCGGGRFINPVFTFALLYFCGSFPLRGACFTSNPALS